jgi:hypothetical protein
MISVLNEAMLAVAGIMSFPYTDCKRRKSHLTEKTRLAQSCMVLQTEQLAIAESLGWAVTSTLTNSEIQILSYSPGIWETSQKQPEH